MFITMLAVFTAFVCLVFAYFFFWTIHQDFPPDPSPGPGGFWPALGGTLVLLAWGLTLFARGRNRADDSRLFYVGLLTAGLVAAAGGAALLAGPALWRMDPTRHAYQAIVWLLLIWSAGHVALGILMQLYCLARRMAGRMTAAHDIDIQNVALYWHFATVTTVIAVAVVAGFPLVS
jgi:cytochrome c oxidase subunit I+III